MNRGVLAATAVVVACAVVSGGCAKKSADARFEKLRDDFLSDYFRVNPVTATWVGERRFDRMMPDVSRAGVEFALQTCTSYLDRLGAIDETKLSRENFIDAEVMKNGIRLEMFNRETLRDYETKPTYYTDLLGSSINLLIERDFAPLDKRLDLVAERLRQFPRIVEEASRNLSNPCRIETETAIAQNRGLIAYVNDVLGGLADSSAAKSRTVADAALPALEALEKFQTYLEKDLVNRSLGQTGLGDERYRRLIDLLLQTDMTSEEIVAAAYAEIQRVHDEMYGLAGPLYAEIAGKKPPAGPKAAERRAVIRRVLDEISSAHPAAGELVDRYRDDYAEATAFVREKNIVAVPDQPLAIVWAPEYTRGVWVTSLEFPGPLDRNLKYYLWVSPVPAEFSKAQEESYLREYNDEMLRIVTIHGAMPGRFVEEAYANRNPSVLRAVFGNAAFREGWAIYAVDLMASMGFRDDDPKLKLVAEKYYLRALTNAIVDAGMHRGTMTESEAVDLLTEDAFQEESEAALKWRRVAIMPGFLSTYFAGYLDMRSLRIEVESDQGDAFRLSAFHEKLLSQGALPARLARKAFFKN